MELLLSGSGPAMSILSDGPLRVAALPFCVTSTPRDAASFSAIRDRLVDAARDGVSFAVFPELSLLGAVRPERARRADLEALAEPLDGARIDALARAVERTGVAAGAGWLERADDGALYNSYVVCMPGGARHVHRKVYSMEDKHLQSGALFDVFDTPWGLKMGILIGADNYLPENARVVALKGATLLVAVHRGAAHGGSAPSRGWYARTLSARAVDNGMFAVLSEARADPKGDEGGMALIADPGGSLIAASVPPSRRVAAASIDPEMAHESVGRRWLGARRPELYASLIASASLHAPGSPRSSSSHASRALRSSTGDDTGPWLLPEGEARARGSVAISFAMVGRKRP